MDRKLSTSLLASLCIAAVAALAFFSFQSPALADDPAPIGEDAPTFTLPNVVDGSEVSLDDYEDKIVVLLFHSTSCPFYAMNENRGYDRVFVQMVEDYADEDVVFLGINSNRGQAAESIAQYIDRHGINYTVVKDEGSAIADAYGARVTPHVMVIDGEGVLRYRGGVEERPGNPNNCGNSDTQYLAPVIDALLDGSEPPFTETQPTGCGIRRG